MSDEAALRDDHRPELNPLFLFRWEETQGSYVLLYPEGVVKLNDTAGEVLRRCDGQRTVAALTEELKQLYSATPDAAALGVRKFLEVSYAKGWIRNRT